MLQLWHVNVRDNESHHTLRVRDLHGIDFSSGSVGYDTNDDKRLTEIKDPTDNSAFAKVGEVLSLR